MKYYSVTGYEAALHLALVVKEKVIAGCFQEDGSYDRDAQGRHTHSTTCVMSSLAQLADLTDDMALLGRVRAFYDRGLWKIRDQLGWVIESSADDASPDRGEVNNSGDIVETALILAKHGYTDYFQDVERIVRGHILPSQLRDNTFITDPPNPDAEDGKYDIANRHLGAFGFPAPYGHAPIGCESISFNMDIVGGAVASLCEVARARVANSLVGTRVNLLFDYESPDVTVYSPYTHRQLGIAVRQSGPLWIRIPPWASADEITLPDIHAKHIRSNGYLIIHDPPLNQTITVDFPLTNSELTLSHRTRDIGVRMRGDSVTSMENHGANLAFFDGLTT